MCGGHEGEAEKVFPHDGEDDDENEDDDALRCCGARNFDEIQDLGLHLRKVADKPHQACKAEAAEDRDARVRAGTLVGCADKVASGHLEALGDLKPGEDDDDEVKVVEPVAEVRQRRRRPEKMVSVNCICAHAHNLDDAFRGEDYSKHGVGSL